MTKFNEGRHPGEFLMMEANGFRSRGKATVKSGAGKFDPGTILGKITCGAATSAAKSGGNTGTGTLVLDASTPILSGAIPGVYQVRFVTATVFNVIGPDGKSIGSGAIGGSNGNTMTFANVIKFALTQAATVFVIGDGFDITIAAGSGKYIPSPNALTAGAEGAEIACAVAIYGGDATSADVDVAIIERDAEINWSRVVFDSTVDSNPKKLVKKTQLAAAGIIGR